MKKQNKIKNKLLKIKWENIFLIIFLPLGIMAMISHNQTQIELIIIEMVLYVGMPFAIRYGIKDIRREALYEQK